MFNKPIYILMTVLLVITSAAQAEVVITTADGNGADTSLENDTQSGDHGPDSVHGADSAIAIRNYEGIRQKFAYIRFDLTGIAGDLSGATLSITVNISNRNRNWLIYGLVDESLDNWDEDTTCYSNAPGILPAALGSFALDETKLQLLGTLSVLENTPTRETPNVYTSITTELNLDVFLQSDTNKLITFVIINENSDSNASYWVATKEGSLAAAPTLTYPNASFSAANNPKPANDADDIIRDGVVLSWTPGASALSHDVYFGQDPNVVRNADRINQMDVLLVQGHEPNTFPLDQLDYNQSYYWRIDEVEGTPDPIYTGQLWHFTTESFAYQIPGEMIIATADSDAPGPGPENTINGSGLDADDLHSIQSTDMWLTAIGESAPVWIKYEFDKPYKLNQMLVWNYNGESILSMYGLKEVSVEYSVDDNIWRQVEDVNEFPQAIGDDGYASNFTVEFGGVAAKYVRITAYSNWGISDLFNQYGLSEVRFMHIPTSARKPSPEDGETDVALDVTLEWGAGREAVGHNVYFGADQQAVADGTAFIMTTNQIGYGPLSLDLGSTYFWRIDEVNNNGTIPLWPGSIWSFTTQEYLVVDDFESYNDIEQGQEGSNLIYFTWADGYDNPATNGSTIGYITVPSLETNTVHDGRQSAPISYNNTTASSSEVTVNTNDLAVGSDWTVGTPESLVMWIYGDPNNSAEQMYVKVNNVKVNFNGDLTQAEWQEFSIDLDSLGINLSNVTTLIIGFERAGATGGEGTVFVDDIWLYNPLDEAVIE